MLKALVIDFDGVIVDTETQWFNIYHDWLKNEFNYDLDIKDYLTCVGANNEIFQAFLEKEVSKDVGFKEFEIKATEIFIEETKDLPLLPGVEKLIKDAHEAGIKLAIATSATRKKPEYHLRRLSLFEYFDVLSTAELSENIKPEPDIFLKAAELLNLKPEECLAIEDSENGLVSANAAGMKCLIVPNKLTKYIEFDNYYMKVDSLADISLEELMKDFSE